jgi:uncharacterized membrane protein YgaE (UPF0421/DUF939 family)
MAFSIWELLKKPAADAASTLIGSVTGMIDEVVTNKEERETLKMQAQKQVQDYTVRLEELAQASEKSFLEDRQNARTMQVAALAQNDLFSKRYVYYLATFWSVAGVAYIFAAPYLEQMGNGQIVNTTLGFLLGTIVATVINFFFGSSKGSADKQDKINALMDNNKK